jgi:hypothetical protein
MRRSHLFGALAVLLLIVAAGAVFTVRRDADTSTSVRADRAAELANAPAADPDIEPGLRPAAGTYEYRGSGDEHLSLLGGATHEFAESLFAVVSLDPDDDCAWSFDPAFVEEHIEHRTYCTKADGTSMRSIERTTNFLGHEQTSTYACTGDATNWTCTEERGAVVKFTATVVDRPHVQIDGAAHEVTHLRVTGLQRNKGRGDETTELWLLPSGLPARILTTRTNSSSAGPLGTMHLRERYDYRLASLEPVQDDRT